MFALCQSKHIAPGHTESHLLSMRVCHSAVHVLKARGDIITGLGANKRAAVDYQCAEVCPAGCCSFGYGIFQKVESTTSIDITMSFAAQQFVFHDLPF